MISDLSAKQICTSRFMASTVVMALTEWVLRLNAPTAHGKNDRYRVSQDFFGHKFYLELLVVDQGISRFFETLHNFLLVAQIFPTHLVLLQVIASSKAFVTFLANKLFLRFVYQLVSFDIARMHKSLAADAAFVWSVAHMDSFVDF